ncbi:MAG: methyltransferase [Candidatus Nanoarchaeia archaeon]|nr:methyltransferase [Candidatus Nanoarchaeia archaeon]
MEHYFTKNPSTKFRVFRIKDNVLENNLEFFTSNSIFSKNSIDDGSKMLVESFFQNEFIDSNELNQEQTNQKLINKKEINKEQKILDLGCAYGFVGISLKKKNKNLLVDMIDINSRAVFVAKRNIILNNLDKGINAFESNGFENIKEKYDYILFNPPQSAGNLICNNLIKDSFNHLNKNASLYVVSRHNKGGKNFKDLMKETFGNAEIIEKKGKYAIYKSTFIN